MFDQLSDRLSKTVKKLAGQTRIKEGNIQAAIKDVRTSLLDADVNFSIVKDFIKSVKKKAIGKEVLDSLNPHQQFIKVIHEELCELMGREHVGLNLKVKPPVIIMLVGLQGSGKTTSCGKLANFLKNDLKRRPYLVPADIYRPAAIEQLKTLAKQIDIPVFDSNTEMDPVDIANQAKEIAVDQGYDTLILDTAGRLQIDNQMMAELRRLSDALNPTEVLFVTDAMAGQNALDVVSTFHEQMNLSGCIITKMDGDARGGVALSVRASTGIPIKYIGTGEKIDGLEAFHPERISSRILDMGDLMTFIEKAQKAYDEKEAQKLQNKIKSNDFSFQDFFDALQQMKKMGSMEDLMKMIPGMGAQLRQIKDFTPPEKEMKKIEAMIQSMTKEEKANHAILDGSRRKRIARGSGTRVQDVNALVKQFQQTRKFMKRFNKLGFRGIMRAFG